MLFQVYAPVYLMIIVFLRENTSILSNWYSVKLWFYIHVHYIYIYIQIYTKIPDMFLIDLEFSYKFLNNTLRVPSGNKKKMRKKWEKNLIPGNF